MKTSRTLGRRSFMTLVAGGGLVGAGLILTAPGAAQVRTRRTTTPRRMAVDADPRDPARMPVVPRPDPPSPPSNPITGVSGNLHGRSQRPVPAPTQRFVVCPGHRRCPRRNP